MLRKDMVSNIWKGIITEEDYRNTLSFVDHLLEDIYKKKHLPDYQQTLDSADNSEPNNIIDNEIKLVSDKELYLRDLKKELEIEKIEIKLTLVIKPNTIIKQKIGDWIKNILGEKVVAVIDIDPDIIGGARISYKGNYYDGTLRRKINDWLINKNILAYGR